MKPSQSGPSQAATASSSSQAHWATAVCWQQPMWCKNHMFHVPIGCWLCFDSLRQLRDCHLPYISCDCLVFATNFTIIFYKNGIKWPKTSRENTCICWRRSSWRPSTHFQVWETTYKLGIFVYIAVETFGSWGSTRLKINWEIGRQIKETKTVNKNATKVEFTQCYTRQINRKPKFCHPYFRWYFYQNTTVCKH